MTLNPSWESLKSWGLTLLREDENDSNIIHTISNVSWLGKINKYFPLSELKLKLKFGLDVAEMN